ncbi:MAG: hypothetical protein GX605_13385, partial [Chloroflexi bacterium]|nr:hypothetical protein [Chloroflexota bacterium]
MTSGHRYSTTWEAGEAALLGNGVRMGLLAGAAIACILFLSLYNLDSYPLTWFDEGSHLHVPKTLVRFGVYADYSSEGFRHYGPTLGVGPTVMLPIAAAFRLFGIGLLQARLVMVLYLLAAIVAAYRLASLLGGRWLAVVATALLVTSRGVALVANGRQVLGEVPGLLFVLLGLWLWFGGWPNASWGRLLVAGLLLGLGTVTKSQYLLVVGPALVLAWLANLLYYRQLPQRAFIVPGLACGLSYAAWQLLLVLYLGPATAAENLAVLREASGGAAFVFSPTCMANSLKILLSPSVYLGALVPAMLHGLARSLSRTEEGQRWGVVWL